MMSLASEESKKLQSIVDPHIYSYTITAYLNFKQQLLYNKLHYFYFSTMVDILI